MRIAKRVSSAYGGQPVRLDLLQCPPREPKPSLARPGDQGPAVARSLPERPGRFPHERGGVFQPENLVGGLGNQDGQHGVRQLRLQRRQLAEKLGPTGANKA